MLVTLRGQRIGHQFFSLHQVLKSNNVLMFIFFVISHHFSSSKCINIEQENLIFVQPWDGRIVVLIVDHHHSDVEFLRSLIGVNYKLITLNIFANSRYSRTCQRLLSNIFQLPLNLLLVEEMIKMPFKRGITSCFCGMGGKLKLCLILFLSIRPI